jgi:hypothetical protein
MVIVGPYQTLAILVDDSEGGPQRGANKNSSEKYLYRKVHFGWVDWESLRKQ